MGLAGLVLSILTAFSIKNPKRNVYGKKKKVEVTPKGEVKVKKKKPSGIKAMIDSLKEVNDNPVCSNIFLAGFIRLFGNVILTAFMPVYF